MYGIYLALAIGLLLGTVWTLLGLFGGLGMGITLGIVAAVAAFAIIGRRFNRRIQPVVEQAQRQMQAGNVHLALQSFESLLPLADWVPMLKGQLYGQMGVLHAGLKQMDKAKEYLAAASHRLVEAKLFYAGLVFRDGEPKKATAVLARCQRTNPKHVLLHNVHAWMLAKGGDVDGAMAQLNALLKKVPENENTQGNLNRLQNGRKMQMKGFGMEWYALGFERPPQSMQQQMMNDPRRGFQKMRRRGR